MEAFCFSSSRISIKKNVIRNAAKYAIAVANAAALKFAEKKRVNTIDATHIPNVPNIDTLPNTPADSFLSKLKYINALSHPDKPANANASKTLSSKKLQNPFAFQNTIFDKKYIPLEINKVFLYPILSQIYPQGTSNC